MVIHSKLILVYNVTVFNRFKLYYGNVNVCSKKEKNMNITYLHTKLYNAQVCNYVNNSICLPIYTNNVEMSWLFQHQYVRSYDFDGF